MRKTQCLLFCLEIFLSLSGFAIVEGRIADPEMSSPILQIKFEKSFETCSGVVIDAHLIFTAGHCLLGTDFTTRRLRATNTRDATGVVTLRISKLKVFPTFPTGTEDLIDQSKINTDFSYIRVQEDLLETFNIPASALPRVARSLSEVQALLAGELVAYGYGTSVAGHRLEKGRMKRELTVRANHSENYGYLFAKSQELGRGLCKGDSGGGLFAVSSQGQLVLLGITSGVSASVPCGDALAISYHNTVYDKLNWVDETRP